MTPVSGAGPGGLDTPRDQWGQRSARPEPDFRNSCLVTAVKSCFRGLRRTVSQCWRVARQANHRRRQAKVAAASQGKQPLVIALCRWAHPGLRRRCISSDTDHAGNVAEGRRGACRRLPPQPLRGRGYLGTVTAHGIFFATHLDYVHISAAIDPDTM